MTPGEHDTDTPFMVELAAQDALGDEGSELERLHAVARTRQRWLLAIVLLVGIGSIWSMRQFSGDRETGAVAPGEDVVAAYLQARPGGASVHSTDGKPLGVLHMNTAQLQVPVTNLRMNPFVAHHGPAESGRGLEQSTASAQIIRERRLGEMEEAVRSVLVQSTMTGRIPLASISGQVLRTGDTLVSDLEHVTIVLRGVRRNHVVLEATDTNLDLTGTWAVFIGN